MAAVALSSNEFGDAVAVDIREQESVRLRKRFVNGVADPLAIGGSAGLFEPIQTVAMALAIDEIQFAIVIDVVTEDGKAGIAEIPISMPLPFVVVCVDLLEPAMSCEHIRFAIAVDIGYADAVAVFLAASQVVDAWLVLTEIDPENT